MISFESDAGLVTLAVCRRRGLYVLERYCAGERTERRAYRLMDIRDHLRGVPPGTVNALISRVMDAA